MIERYLMRVPVQAFVWLLTVSAAFAGEPPARQKGKLLEWGWTTPEPLYVRDHVAEMERVPDPPAGVPHGNQSRCLP